MKRTLPLLLSAMLVLAACGDDDSGDGSGDATQAESDGDSMAGTGGEEMSDEIACDSIEIDEMEGSLTVYSGRSEELIKPLIDCFTERSGLDVEVRYGQSEEMALQITEEGEDSPADVFFSQGAGSLGVVETEGLLAALPTDLLEQVDPEYASNGGKWVGTSGRVRSFVHNTETVADAELPKKIDDVLKPEWKGRLGVAPSNASFIDFVAAVVLDRGEDGAREFLEGLVANEPTTFPNNTAIVEAASRGQIDAGLVNHYYAAQMLAEDPDLPIANHFFEKGDLGSYVLVSGAGVLVGAGDELPQAEAFVRFLLSKGAQEFFRDSTKEYPLAAGVKPDASLPDLSTVGLENTDEGALGDANRAAVDLIESTGLATE